MKKNMNSTSTDSLEGFTKFPHTVLERLLLGQLSKRELILVLLIARLTFGCHKEWAKIIQADLSAIGIRPNHARSIIASSLEKRLILQNQKTKQYKLGSFDLTSAAGDAERLKKLVGKQLIDKSSYNGNSDIPIQGTDGLLNQEHASSYNGNARTFLEGEIIRSDNASAVEPKDNDKDKFIQNVKYNVTSPNFIDPNTFKPRDDKERAAVATWRWLEADKPKSFGLYLSLARKGLPADTFYSLATEIGDDKTISNKGAAFSKRTYEYSRQHLICGKAANV